MVKSRGFRSGLELPEPFRVASPRFFSHSFSYRSTHSFLDLPKNLLQSKRHIHLFVLFDLVLCELEVSCSIAINMTDESVPIAIVGLSCRLPGGVGSPEDLWSVCAEQRDVWQPIPNKRMNNNSFYHPDPGRNGTVSTCFCSQTIIVLLLTLKFSLMYEAVTSLRRILGYSMPSSSI